MSVPDPRIVERWRTTFAMWRNSGLSVAAFCRSRDLNFSSFFTAGGRSLEDLDRPTEIRPRSQPDLLPCPSFVHVRVIPDAVVEVILPSGLQLRVPLSADAPQLARLVLALGAPPC